MNTRKTMAGMSPSMTSKSNGTLTGSKAKATNSSVGTKEKPSGLFPKTTAMAALEKGGKACKS